jgi:hypothetical protein
MIKSGLCEEASAENIHPYGQPGNNMSIEDQLGAAAPAWLFYPAESPGHW